MSWYSVHSMIALEYIQMSEGQPAATTARGLRPARPALPLVHLQGRDEAAGDPLRAPGLHASAGRTSMSDGPKATHDHGASSTAASPCPTWTASLAFYRDALGLEVEFDVTLDAVEYVRAVHGHRDARRPPRVPARVPGSDGVFVELIEYHGTDGRPVVPRAWDPGHGTPLLPRQPMPQRCMPASPASATASRSEWRYRDPRRPEQAAAVRPTCSTPTAITSNSSSGRTVRSAGSGRLS